MKLAISILNGKYTEEESIKRINKTNADFFHVDVIDGKLLNVPPTKFEYLHTSEKPLQIHLMVTNPFNYISTYSLYNTDSIIFQSELDDDIDGLLDYIKSKGIKCGLALYPETNINRIIPYLEKLDYVLILSVTPGKSGQKILESTLYKIDILKKLREEKKYNYEIIIDGGINSETINKVRKADIVVSASFICNSDNYQEQIDKLNL